MILQAACKFTPETMPPEMLRQIRAGIFQALAKSWDEFMRSPQFLSGMKQMLDNTVAFRQITGDYLARFRRETQGITREDLDRVLVAVREMEGRLNRRIDDLIAGGAPHRNGAGETPSSLRQPVKKGGASRKPSGGKKAARKSAAKGK